jgi:hypothetical protein
LGKVWGQSQQQMAPLEMMQQSSRQLLAAAQTRYWTRSVRLAALQSGLPWLAALPLQRTAADQAIACLRPRTMTGSHRRLIRMI